MRKERTQLPEHFKSNEEAAELWDSHKVGGCRDLTGEAHFEVDTESRTFLASLEMELAKEDIALAHAIAEGEGSARAGRDEVFNFSKRIEATMNYEVVIQKSEEGYSISCPALPGCWSQGETEEEALAHIRDAIQDYLAAANENRKT
jgi:predicted RNase H-like HicB family nuclease